MDLRDEILTLMKTPTDRDKQHLVGASNLSNPCTRCLGEQMLHSGGSEPGKFWMGAWTGTAMHASLEALCPPEWLPERRVVLGEIPGYGVLRSTLDLYVPERATVGDYKSTTRDKLVYIKRAVQDPEDQFEVTKVTEARYKVSTYLNQTMLYGRAMQDEGFEVHKVALIFLCRDGTGDQDVWVHEEDYDRARADKVWTRAVNLWNALQEGRDPATLSSHPMCYHCNSVRDWSK